MSELVKVDHQEFGLQESKAKEIEQQFRPMLEKMTELEDEFNKVVSLPIDESTVEKAKTLRLKYVKVRTGTAAIHKEQKAFYLAGGRFVDGWKNAQLFASQGKEDRLMEIEKHFENLEKERLEKIRADRWEKLSAYMEDEPSSLELMPDDVFEHLLSGAKAAHEAKIEAEKKAEEERLERERIQNLTREREKIITPVYRFFNPSFIENLGELSGDDFEKELAKAQKSMSEHEAEQEKQRKENERLKAEAEAREKAIEEERKRQAEKEAAERKERERIQAETEAKLKAEREAREKAEAEIKARQDAEEKAQKKAGAEAKKAAKAPEQERLKRWVASISAEHPIDLDGLSDEGKKIVKQIDEKTEALKQWAYSLIENQ